MIGADKNVPDVWAYRKIQVEGVLGAAETLIIFRMNPFTAGVARLRPPESDYFVEVHSLPP